MTFRLRTALVVLAVTALTMGLAFGAVWWAFVHTQRVQLDDALVAVAAREAAEAAQGQLEFTDAPGPSANAVGPLPKYGVMYGPGGRTVTKTDNLTAAPPLPRAQPLGVCFDFEHEGQRLRGVQLPVPGSTLRVLVATSRDDLEDDARILARAMALALVVGSAWVFGVALLVASRLTQDHRAIADVARRVAGGDPTARVRLEAPGEDLRQLADDLNAMLERLVGLVAAQERFVAHAAHELRTPLTALRIELEHALATARTDEAWREAAEGALGSVGRLVDLADDLLELARSAGTRPSGAGPASVAPEASAAPHAVTDVERVVEDALADVVPLARAAGVALEVSSTAVRVRGDRRALARVARNLLENAVRFAPRGSTVRLVSAADDDHVRIEVRDEGPGLHPDDATRVFEPFARGRAAAPSGALPGGAGLGLTIARSVARGFGGDLEATAGDGPGGCFVLTLPRERAPEA